MQTFIATAELIIHKEMPTKEVKAEIKYIW